MSDDDPTPTPDQLDAPTREKAAARIWREVFKPPRTTLWTHRGDVPTEVADRCRAAAARLHADGLLPARGSADAEALDEAVRRRFRTPAWERQQLWTPDAEKAFRAGWAAAEEAHRG